VDELPPPHGIFIVAVAPLPLAVTPAPVKLRVVIVVDCVLHSSCTVIVPPPPLGTANTPSHRKKVVASRVPVASILATGTVRSFICRPCTWVVII
jgi:hypothetical protein